MHKKIVMLLVAISLCLMTACDSTAIQNPESQNKQEETDKDKEEQEDKKQKEDTKEDQKDSEEQKTEESEEQAAAGEDAIAGTWILALETNYTGQPNDKIGDMEVYSYPVQEGDGREATLDIYEEEGKLYADFSEYAYESHEAGYHLPVETAKEALYDGCENTGWSAKIVNPREEEPVLCFTLLDADKLVSYSAYTEEDVDEPWSYITVNTYLREGSEAYKNKDDLKYNQTVTVSNVDDLVDAIGNNTTIILEEGVYNINDLNFKKFKNHEFANASSFGEENIKRMTINDVSYLRLMAEQGAEVEICIESPYDPVLSFDNCNNLELDGLILGHHVEPGTCGGSVVTTQNCSSIAINNCHLYGCGAYGVEAFDSYDLSVNDTEIYECTYGITSLYNVYDAAFKNCDVHDNKEYDLIWLSGSGGVEFDSCKFENNRADSDYNNTFVNATDSYGVSFKNCKFIDNVYEHFSEGDVEIENCSFKDKPVSSKK